MANEVKLHEGNPQDEYNKIQNGYPYEHLQEEAAYILVEQEDGTFNLDKKPDTVTVASVTDVWGFIEDKEKVLIVRASGRYDRFNFDIASYYPVSE